MTPNPTSQAALTIVIPVLNENQSLHDTIDILMRDNATQIAEILLVTHPTRTLPESLEAIQQVIAAHPNVIRQITQNMPFVGGAIRTGLAAARAPWTLMMACDGETDPALVKSMLAALVQTNADMITASRWIAGGSFTGYGWLKRTCNAPNTPRTTNRTVGSRIR